MQVGVEEDGNYGNCNWGYSCSYTNCVSWTSPVQPLRTRPTERVQMTLAYWQWIAAIEGSA